MKKFLLKSLICFICITVIIQPCYAAASCNHVTTEWVIKTNATNTTNGVIELKCKVCNEILDYVEITSGELNGKQEFQVIVDLPSTAKKGETVNAYIRIVNISEITGLSGVNFSLYFNENAFMPTITDAGEEGKGYDRLLSVCPQKKITLQNGTEYFVPLWEQMCCYDSVEKCYVIRAAAQNEGATIYNNDELVFCVPFKMSQTYNGTASVYVLSPEVKGTTGTTFVNTYGRGSRDTLSTGDCEHKYGDWIVEKNATCTEDGSEIRICSECGDENKHIIPALGHDSGEWFTVKEATYTATGLRELRCTRCQTVLDTEIISKLEYTSFYLAADSKYRIDDKNGYLYGSSEKTTLSVLHENVLNEKIRVKKSNGVEITNTSAFLGTGATVELLSSTGNVIATLKFVLLGDTTGDGILDSTDYLQIKRTFQNMFVLEGEYAIAADVDGNNELGTTDYLRVKRHFQGMFDIY